MRKARVLAAAAIVTAASGAAAYTQDRELESALGRSDPAALALLPAKGFRNGVAGFFAAYQLYVVPGSQRAWCWDSAHGVLGPGCYVEFYFQGKGLKPRKSDGTECGLLGRWYKPPGATRYESTPGAHFSQAMADDDASAIDAELYTNIDPRCE